MLRERADGHPEAYFRGRKLKGKKLSVPEGYRGVVAMMKEKEGEKNKGGDLERGKLRINEEEKGEEDEEGVQTVGTLEEVAEFEEVIVWDHEAIRSGEDTFVKGMEEWIRFAEVVSLFLFILKTCCDIFIFLYFIFFWVVTD